MWARCLGFLWLGATGCAQLFGIDQTSTRDAGIDGRADGRVDARVVVDGRPDAMRLPCVEGDAHVQDPMTGACYMFFTGPNTRDQGRTACAGIGTGVTLASVKDMSVNDLLATLIGVNTAFVGGSDEATEGVFKWEDGTNVAFANWNTGEPNNGGDVVQEDCIVIVGTVAGKWDDRPCAPSAMTTGGSYSFVCERD